MVSAVLAPEIRPSQSRSPFQLLDDFLRGSECLPVYLKAQFHINYLAYSIFTVLRVEYFSLGIFLVLIAAVHY
jgi:hypothetical protein